MLFLNTDMTFKVRDTYTGVQRIIFQQNNLAIFITMKKCTCLFTMLFLNTYLTFKINAHRDTYTGVRRIEGAYFSTKLPAHFHHYEMYMSLYHA